MGMCHDSSPHVRIHIGKIFNLFLTLAQSLDRGRSWSSESIVRLKIVSIKKMNFTNWRLSHIIQNVSPRPAKANNSEALTSQFLRYCLNPGSTRSGVDIFEDRLIPALLLLA